MGIHLHGSSGTAALQTAVVTLTNDQIKAGPSGDITLLSGITGKIISPIQITAKLTIVSAYTNINASAVGIVYNGDDAASYFDIDSNEFGTPGTYETTLIGGSPILNAANEVLTARWTALSNVNGTALVLSIGNGASGNFAGGNASNSLVLVIHYLTVDVP